MVNVTFVNDTEACIVAKKFSTWPITKALFIVGIDEVYIDWLQLVFTKCTMLSNLKSMAFLVTLRDMKSNNVDKDDIKG
jgi:hypothetical protein